MTGMDIKSIGKHIKTYNNDVVQFYNLNNNIIISLFNLYDDDA